MKTSFDITKSSRDVLLGFIERHTLEQLNTIPEGFNNNLIWNIGHILVVQQMLIYKLSNLPMMISDEMVEKYKKGTKPESNTTQEEVDEIKELLHITLERTRNDFTKGLFKSYNEFTTMMGFTIRTSEEAIVYNNYHEAIHTGIMMQIRKFI